MLRTRGRIEESISQKLNFRTEAQQFHQQFQLNVKTTNVARNMQYAWTSNSEEILKFNTFKGFEKKVAYKTAIE
jgi:hypothetical protein